MHLKNNNVNEVQTMFLGSYLVQDEHIDPIQWLEWKVKYVDTHYVNCKQNFVFLRDNYP